MTTQSVTSVDGCEVITSPNTNPVQLFYVFFRAPSLDLQSSRAAYSVTACACSGMVSYSEMDCYCSLPQCMIGNFGWLQCGDTKHIRQRGRDPGTVWARATPCGDTASPAYNV